MEAPRSMIQRARSLRRRMTPPEARLWTHIRRSQLEGWRFRRQHPIGPYVLDFFCDAARLAIEVDGEVHAFGAQPAHDARRDAWLHRRGIETLRLPARLVFYRHRLRPSHNP